MMVFLEFSAHFKECGNVTSLGAFGWARANTRNLGITSQSLI